jgi:fluoroacetyl-CoA thioesterase
MEKSMNQPTNQLTQQLKPGLTRTETFVVAEQHTAYHIGSGDERVLGTPWMISFMERVCNRLLAEHLPETALSVGTHVDVHHLAPSPIHSIIRVKVEILAVKKNRITLSVAAWDHEDQIGSGKHTRAVVNKARFMQRADEK